MDIRLRRIGNSMLEMIVYDFGTTITADITKLDSTIEDGLIEKLKSVVSELEEWDEKIKRKSNG